MKHKTYNIRSIEIGDRIQVRDLRDGAIAIEDDFVSSFQKHDGHDFVALRNAKYVVPLRCCELKSPRTETGGNISFKPEMHPTFWVDWHSSGASAGLGAYLADRLGIVTLDIFSPNDIEYGFEIKKEFDDTVAFPFDPDMARKTGGIDAEELSSLLNWAASLGYIEPGRWVVSVSH